MGGHPEILRGQRCGRDVRAVDIVTWACEAASGPVLLALDAPLGWPTPLSDSVSAHRAGEPLAAEPDVMFSRETGRFIRARLGKKPLEVAADRIARTAHAALALLRNLRSPHGIEIPLARKPGRLPSRVAAIEVYPAATLIGHGIRSGGYMRPGDASRRLKILEALLSAGIR